MLQMDSAHLGSLQEADEMEGMEESGDVHVEMEVRHLSRSAVVPVNSCLTLTRDACTRFSLSLLRRVTA